MEQDRADSGSVSTTKRYDVAIVNIPRTKAAVTPYNSTEPVFEFELAYFVQDIKSKRTKHSVVLRPWNESQILGASDIDWRSVLSPIRLCFGDPDAPEATEWEPMTYTEATQSPSYELKVDLEETGGIKVLDWKRTHKGDMGTIAKRVDWLNLKLTDRESGKIVARFVHHPWCGRKRGYFELEAFDDGRQWEAIVLLSGMAYLEYLRKISGWSW